MATTRSAAQLDPTLLAALSNMVVAANFPIARAFATVGPVGLEGLSLSEVVDIFPTLQITSIADPSVKKNIGIEYSRATKFVLVYILDRRRETTNYLDGNCYSQVKALVLSLVSVSGRDYRI
mmetsp:Transcript_6917/g.14692  ORF Transcript_6917/g.14692 Transcript_6917/m.14692 type:complete len:122 (+) Transcript_6917:422-787(+)|eukprot:CAMPEP_0168307580 /NCGR_PEP_ID=MMETSP0142_2-20121227/58532_1 /TAXON_ID=44445 /ORGANISM="Pseudo-nitzschia australis, Strain 10249 10 AB" /LENGTH=121 /DNA_ID=CAMNT_0008259713 /DNA_START=405 /DNA_END=770 /DNA_ORIENTATION=-